MLNLNDLAVFVSAVEHGGFAAAARRLGMPKSTISKRVAALEGSLEARLIQRSSRSFVLTEAGRAFHDHARAALIEAEAAEAVVRRRAAEPSGTVRITASVPTAQHHLAAHLPRLARAFPKLHVQLDVTDRFVDVMQEGYDIAVRSHFAPLPDSGLVQRRLLREAIVLVAAPAYLDLRGEPSAPEQLAAHDGLLVSTAAPAWQLTGEAEETRTVSPMPRMTANESTVLLGAAVAGLGIACLPGTMCRAALASGQVRHVLPGWSAGSVITTLVMPHRRGQLPGVRATVDFLVDCLGQPDPVVV